MGEEDEEQTSFFLIIISKLLFEKKERKDEDDPIPNIDVYNRTMAGHMIQTLMMMNVLQEKRSELYFHVIQNCFCISSLIMQVVIFNDVIM